MANICVNTFEYEDEAVCVDIMQTPDDRCFFEARCMMNGDVLHVSGSFDSFDDAMHDQVDHWVEVYDAEQCG